MTEDPRSLLGVMGVLVVLVTVMDSGIYMCDSSCSHTCHICCASAIPTKAGFENYMEIVKGPSEKLIWVHAFEYV